MDAPTTGTGLLLLILFVIPGAVYGLTFERVAGPLLGNEFSLRILRAIMASTAFHCVYLLLFSAQIVSKYRNLSATFKDGQASGIDGAIKNLPLYGAASLALLLFFPGLVGLLLGFFARSKYSQNFKREILWRPNPPAWDAAFSDPRHAWVRVKTKDGLWIGGKWTDESCASASPAAPELFLAQAIPIDANGTFQAAQWGEVGVWIRCDEVLFVELIRPKP